MKVLFIQAKANKNVVKVLNKNIKYIPEKKIGLLATAQFVEQLSKLKRFLESKGKIAVIGKPTGSAILAGQVLGCDVSSATAVEKKVDCFLYVGTGDFHFLGVLAKTTKQIYVLDPFTENIKQLTKEEKLKLWKKQILRIAKFKDCKVVGILVSTKPGQYKLQSSAEKIKEKLEKQGKKVYLFICDNIIDAELQNFTKINGWVNTACPRLVDDIFDKPFVNACELE